MKPNQLTALVLRLLGIFCLIQCLNAVPLVSSTIAYAAGPASRNDLMTDATQVYIVVVSILLRLLVGYILLTRADALAARLIPSDAADLNPSGISLEQIQMLAFAVAGAVIFSDSLPQLASLVMNIVYRSAMLNWRYGFVGGGSLAKAALGLWMFVGSRSFVNFWQSFRNFATPKSVGP